MIIINKFIQSNAKRKFKNKKNYFVHRFVVTDKILLTGTDKLKVNMYNRNSNASFYYLTGNRVSNEINDREFLFLQYTGFPDGFFLIDILKNTGIPECRLYRWKP